MINQALFSSAYDSWETPAFLYESLDREFHFTLDAAASHSNHKCDLYFTISDNALVQDWGGHTVFCNPPYGRQLHKWVKKAFEESMKPNTVVVLLIPSRTDTSYFHDYILKYARIRFLRGRITFVGASQPAPFPSMIAIFDGE